MSLNIWGRILQMYTFVNGSKNCCLCQSLTNYRFLLCPSELMQTEMHHIRTLRIMSEVYSKGLQKELQVDLQTVEKLFPVLDDLLELHTQHLLRLLERKRESQLEGASFDGGFIINRIGDLLVGQVRGQQGRCEQGVALQKMPFFTLEA